MARDKCCSPNKEHFTEQQRECYSACSYYVLGKQPEPRENVLHIDRRPGATMCARRCFPIR